MYFFLLFEIINNVRCLFFCSYSKKLGFWNMLKKRLNMLNRKCFLQFLKF